METFPYILKTVLEESYYEARIAEEEEEEEQKEFTRRLLNMPPHKAEKLIEEHEEMVR